MYHEVTYKELERRRQGHLRAVVAGMVVCALVACGLAYARLLLRDQGATALRSAVVDAALQCCAVEGSFPSSLAHLEDHYGLVINERDYLVTYEWLGDNVAPAVVVRPR